MQVQTGKVVDSKVLELGQINFEIDKESDKLMPSETLFGDLTVLTSVHDSTLPQRADRMDQ